MMVSLTRDVIFEPGGFLFLICFLISPRIDIVKLVRTQCKMQRTPCRRGASSSYEPKPQKFGDVCICDHIIAYGELPKGINGEEEALVLVDIATGWMFRYPVKSKSAKDVIASVIACSSALSGKSN